MVDDDNTDCKPVRSTIGLTPIQSLFDFSHSHWVEMFSRSAIQSFDEELELYEMLDLDAEGVEDIGVNVDDDIGDIARLKYSFPIIYARAAPCCTTSLCAAFSVSLR
jgi:hypothetical protein